MRFASRSAIGGLVGGLSMLLAGCGVLPYPKYPDNTDWFYKIYDEPARADLNLLQMSCDRRDDGSLVVVARVRNMGSDILSPQEMLTGERGSFRVVATLTSTNGEREVGDSTVPVPVIVPMTVDFRVKGLRMPPANVARIVVVADPDSIVPDPTRHNNTLSWQGTLDPNHPECLVAR